jgi:hypothetical protein
MRDSSVSSRALGVAGAGLGQSAARPHGPCSVLSVIPPVGLPNINAREIQCVQKDSGSFWARLLH